MTVKVNAVKAVYDDEVAQLADLDAQLAEIQAEEDAKSAQLGRAQGPPRRARPGGLRQRPDVDPRDRPVGRLVHRRPVATSATSSTSATRTRPSPPRSARTRRRSSRSTRRSPRRASTPASSRPTTAAQKKVLDGSLADLKKARAKLRKLEAATAHQLALQRTAYQPARRQRRRGQGDPRQRGRGRSRNLQRKIDRLMAEQHTGGGDPVAVQRHASPGRSTGSSPRSSAAPGSRAEPPLGNCAHFHNGIDIADPMDTPIHAAGDGKVDLRRAAARTAPGS